MTVSYVLYLKAHGNRGSDAVRELLRQMPPQYQRQVQTVSWEDTRREMGAALPDYLRKGAPVLCTYEDPPTVYRGSDVVTHMQSWTQGRGPAAGRGGPPHHRMTPAGRMPPPGSRDDAAAAAEPVDALPAVTSMDPSPAIHGAVADAGLYRTRIVRDGTPTSSGRRNRNAMEEEIKQFNAMRSSGARGPRLH